MTHLLGSRVSPLSPNWLRGITLAGLALCSGCPDQNPSTDDSAGKDQGGLNQVPDAGPGDPPVGCSADAWCWQFPTPQGNSMWATWGSGPSDVWGVGESGTILHFDGKAWSMVRSPTNSALYGIWGSSPSNIFAVGNRGTVIHWDGTTWSPLPLGAAGAQVARLFGVWSADGSEVWFVGDHVTAGTAILQWNGTTATRFNVPAGVSKGLRAIWGTGKTSIYAAGESGTLLRWDGNAWGTFGPAMTVPWSAISGTSDSNFFLASRSGLVYRWNGMTLANIPVATSPTINSLWSDGTSIWAAGDLRYPVTGDPTQREGMLLKWDGTTFSRITTTPKVHISGLWGTGSSVYFAGVAGTMGSFDGSSIVTTTPLENLTGNNGAIYGLSIRSSGDPIAVGDSGATLFYRSGGWVPDGGPITLRLYSVIQHGSETLAVGYDFGAAKGVALKWSGTAWTSETLPTTDRLVKVASDGSNAYAVGENRLFLVRTSGAWKQVSVPMVPAATLRDIAVLDSSHVWLVGGGDRTDRVLGPQMLFYDGTSVSVISPPARYGGVSGIFRGVWAADLNNVFVVGNDYGTVGTPLLKWDHTAQKWTDLSPTSAPVTSQELFSVWGRSPSDVYTIGKNGLVLHFNGSTWTREQSGTTNNLVSITGSGKQAYVTGIGGSILRKALP